MCSRGLKFAFSSMLLTLLSGCMVGPDFHRPIPPVTPSYTPCPIPHKTARIPKAGRAGASQKFMYGETIPAAWWKLFHSRELNGLIQAGLRNSPNLVAATATLEQAEQLLYAQIGSTLLPSVSANLTGERQRFSNSSVGQQGLGGGSNIFNLFNANVSVAYTFDFFGLARRQIEGFAAKVDYQQYELGAAYLTLTSNIVTTAINVASLRAQIKATIDIIRSEENQLAIMQKQLKLGGISGADVFTQETQVAQVRATLPPLQQNLAKSNHALSVLIGELPSYDNLPKFNLDRLILPTHLPVTCSSQLVRQRPDIQASEALLHYASAQIGVATANMYPQVSITGQYGWEGEIFSGLFKPSTVVWNFGTAIAQPIFNGGALIAQKRAAVAAYYTAFAQYKQTVLQAFQNVADTLRALQNDAKALRAQKDAELAARQSLIISQQQYRYGGVTYLQFLTAERNYQQARIQRIQAQAARYTDTAALYQAMGGGWWQGGRCC